MKYINISFTIFFLIIFFNCKLYAQHYNDSLVSQLSVKWANAKDYTLKLAALMPESEYDFKPVKDEMSFKEQLLHIRQNILWISGTYLFVKVPEKKDPKEMNKAAVIKSVNDAYDEGMKAHNITSSQLDETVKFFAGPKSRRQMLILMHDHQTHHAGQLIVYLRLKGIKPPDYVGW
ncbi:MAG: hypothetical protein NVSMB45_17000 [Ginsengibacter sp.]